MQSDHAKKRGRDLHSLEQFISPPLKVVLIYAVLGFLWIFLSDWLLALIIPEMAGFALVQTFKGLVFVLATSVILFIPLRRYFSRMEKAITELSRAEKELQQLNANLEQRVQARTAELEAANQELDSFSYSVSHDLRAPLRIIDGFSQALLEDYAQILDEQGQDYLHRIRAGTQRMGKLIDDLLLLSKVNRKDLSPQKVDLSALVRECVQELRQREPQRKIQLNITPDLQAWGDPSLLYIALRNLLENAWKFTAHKEQAWIEFGLDYLDSQPIYFIRDNGVGLDMTYADKLFQAFQRLHASSDYPGSGIGLATVARIIRRHQGQIWAQAEVDKGAKFSFTLPEQGI